MNSKKKTTKKELIIQSSELKNTNSKILVKNKKEELKLDEKTDKLIENAKESLDKMQHHLNTTALTLPSLVLTRVTEVKEIDGILENKFEIDLELIEMLEEFFERLVYLLNLRSSFDKKLHQTYKQIKRLKKSTTIREFKGNLQLLGITLIEMEQIIKNYQEMYTNLFNEQALLQFQLMEQLMMFRDKDTPSFYSLFEESLKTFTAINEELSDLTE
ncbi:MAG TPA: hypothetical protein VMX55_07560 [candidate division Zixibacteria bacterium]|nr:hypothetical protein [candidate division Zixibacteria bacterium]